MERFTFFGSRLWALMRKETIQTLRNRQMIWFLLVAPVLQLLIYGVALNPDIHDIRLGVVDYVRTNASRELVAAFVENKVFTIDRMTSNTGDLTRRLRDGRIDAGLIIPPDFDRDRARGRNGQIQVLIDGVNAYTAGLTASYTSEIVQSYERSAIADSGRPSVVPKITFLYNPGLRSSWYFVPGVIGMLMTMLGIITMVNEAVREKEHGTLEQLLMTPATSLQVLVAKVVPTFVLIMAAFFLALTIGHVVFGVPLRGNPLTLSAGSALYVVVTIGIGLMFATVAQTMLQGILMSLFVILPMTILSGTVTPLESMPPFWLMLTLVNPLRHYSTILRDVLIKGSGLDVVWPHMLFLAVFAIVLLAISSMRFRSQLR